MKRRIALTEVLRRAALHGIEVQTSCPGDGVRRYEFTFPAGGPVYRAHGSNAASHFLDGVSLALWKQSAEEYK